MRLALALILIAHAAHADDLCAPGIAHKGAPIDLDLDRARVGAALKLVADAAHASLVVADDVTGTVTLHLQQVPWDAAACAIASVAHIALEYRDKILIATKR
jgi:protein transport protein HofQ